MSVRTTLHLDKDLYTHLKRRVSSRKMSQFINQAVAEKLQYLEQDDLEAAMKEGYLATRKDRTQLNPDQPRRLKKGLATRLRATDSGRSGDSPQPCGLSEE